MQYSGDAVLVADPARADHHGGGDFGARAGEVLHRSQRSRRVAERLHRRGVVPERPQLVLVLVRGQVPGVVGFGSSVGFGFGGFRGVIGPRRSFRVFSGILGAGSRPPERGFRRLVALLGKVHDDVRGVPRRCFDGRGAPVGRARVHVRAVLQELVHHVQRPAQRRHVHRRGVDDERAVIRAALEQRLDHLHRGDLSGPRFALVHRPRVQLSPPPALGGGVELVFI